MDLRDAVRSAIKAAPTADGARTEFLKGQGCVAPARDLSSGCSDPDRARYLAFLSIVPHESESSGAAASGSKRPQLGFNFKALQLVAAAANLAQDPACL